ncbi:MAG: glycosidase [Microgenomates group bacterium]
MVFARHPKNPILLPDKYHTWEDRAVFNPGATLFQGKFHLLYRAIGEYDQYISTVGHAVSDDGINFVREAEPVIRPEKDYEQYGIEDLRINPLEGSFYLTHTVLGSPANQGGEPHRVGLIKTNDFKSFERLGVITPKEICSRNGVLFPEKINDHYVLLHRPLYPFGSQENSRPVAPEIWISFSHDLLVWENQQFLMESQYWWESYKIGGGPPPIRTNKGWLLIYHGVDQERVYRAGAVLLDLTDPRKVIFRTKEPILEPKEEYELFGDVPAVVFPTGLVEKDGLLYLYYGAADKTVCLATVSLEELLESFV